MCLVNSAANFNFAKDCQQLRRGDFRNGPIAKIRKNVFGNPLHHVPGVIFRPDGGLIAVPLPCHGLKGRLEAFCPELFLGRRINAAAQLFFGGNAGFPRLFQGKLGVCAEGEEFFTALKVIFDAPAFCAARGDKKKKSIAVKEFLRLIKGLDRTNGGIGKGHRGILLARVFHTP